MKSIYQRLGEVTEKIAEAGKITIYNERSKNLVSTEAKVNCGERLLKEIGESTGPIRKFNGANDNATEFRESASADVAAANKTAIAGYTILGFSEAEARKVLGLAPAEVEELGEAKVNEFRFAVSIGLSESDALRLCKK